MQKLLGNRPQAKAREYLFDNYKVFLIVLVVVGHFIEPNYEHNAFLYELKWGIVSFHMPAFIFISGYFSKKAPDFQKLLNSLVIPYFVYEVFYYLLYIYVLDRDTELYFMHPKFSLWYLMALFAWKLITPYVLKIPGHLAISIAAGLLVGFTNIDNFLSIPRILYFYPFFLAGVHFKQSWLETLRNSKRAKTAAIVILVAFVVFLAKDSLHDLLTPKIFYGRYSYHAMDLSNVTGVLVRILCYIASFLLIYAFMMVLPRKKTAVSYLGERTMSIYIFHGFAYCSFKYGSRILSTVNTNLESLVLLVFCLFLVWLFSRKPFVSVTNKVAHLMG